MEIKFFEQRTVQKGKGLSSIESVQKRLKEIYDSPKSRYYKALMEGRIQVHQIVGPRARWNIIEINSINSSDIKGAAVCAECSKIYFSIVDDYLCHDCRLTI